MYSKNWTPLFLPTKQNSQPENRHPRFSASAFYKMQCNARNAESELNFYAKSNLSKIPGDNFLLSNLKISNKI